MDKIVRKDIRKSKGEKKGRKVLEKRLEEKEKHRKVRPGKIGGPGWATRWMESPSEKVPKPARATLPSSGG